MAKNVIAKYIDDLVKQGKDLSIDVLKTRTVELVLLIAHYKQNGFLEKEEIVIYSEGYSRCETIIDWAPSREVEESSLNLKVSYEKDLPPSLEPIPGCCCQNDHDICKKSNLLELFKCRNFKRFVNINPIVKNAFTKNKNFSLLFTPNYRLKTNVEDFESNVKNLYDLILLQHQKHNSKEVRECNWDHRIILIIALCDFLMDNYFYVCLYKNYYINAFFELNRIHSFNIKYHKKIKQYSELNYLLDCNISSLVWLKHFKKGCAEYYKNIFFDYNIMDFENQGSMPANQGYQSGGQSLLGSLVETVGNDLINVGSRYLEQKLDQWSENL